MYTYYPERWTKLLPATTPAQLPVTRSAPKSQSAPGAERNAPEGGEPLRSREAPKKRTWICWIHHNLWKIYG